MSYLAKTATVLATLLVMAGCGLQHFSKPVDVSDYPYRHADFDYRYAWKTVATDQGLLIDGVMKNVRYPYIDSVMVTVHLLDKDGKTVATAADLAAPQQSREGEVSYFSLALGNVRPAAGDIFRFQVHYTGNEGGDQSRVDWHSSFKADALTGTIIRPHGRDPDKW
jgi:hypothetical protein